MDCRNLFIVALVASLSSMGCLPLWQNTRPQQNVRLPKPGTEISYAKFQVGQATKSKELSQSQREKHLVRARDAYKSALKLNPGDKDAIEATVGLATVYGLLGDHARASNVYQEGCKKHPNSAKMWASQGRYLGKKRKDFAGAVACLKKAIALKPEDRDVARALGVYTACAGHPQESMKWLVPLYGKAKAHMNLATTYVWLQRPAEARVQLQLAVQESPSLMQTAQGRKLLAILNRPTPRTNPNPVANIGFNQIQPSAVNSAPQPRP